MIRFTQLNDSSREAFLELLREAWQPETFRHPETRDVVQWRFFDRPDDGAVTFLAMNDDRCIAMVDSMLRPYLLDGQRIVIRETADWYCTPEWRSRGVGAMLLMRIRGLEPIFVMGGTRAGTGLLSKMRGWAKLPNATSFILPLKARALAGTFVRSHWPAKETLVRVIPNFLAVKSSRKISPPAGRRARSESLRPTEAIPLLAGNTSGLVQILGEQQWGWLVRMRALVDRI